jgi:lipoyl(octanoyl) transferase
VNLLRVIDLGRSPYQPAYRAQCDHVEEVLASRAAGTPEPGRLLLVEHEPVITVGRRIGGLRNLVASPDSLAHHGIELVHSDRGGDITYHGPGQLVAYPILDLNLLNLGLHDYMRLLEQAVIDTVAQFGIAARRDPPATGVWVDQPDAASAKLCAMGVRIRQWISMHGLALNVTTNLEHFGLIVPCGLAGRHVTSMHAILGPACPGIPEVKVALARAMDQAVTTALNSARLARAAVEGRDARSALPVGPARR